MTKSDSQKKPNKKEKDLVQKMAEAGVHFGHSKSRRNPRMEPYIQGTRSDINIINLEESIKKLEQALKFIKETAKKGGVILFVGTYPQARKLVKKAAEECKMPYVTQRWLGGTLTNFGTISKRIKHLLDLEKKKKVGELEKYTKKEQMLFDEEIRKLNRNFGGIKSISKLPDAVLVLSITKDSTAIKEAQKKKIPLIGLADTDSDPSLVQYPVPSNDDAISALELMLKQIKEAILKK